MGAASVLQPLILARQLRLEDLDGRLQLACLVVRAATSLFQHEVFFADLGQGALQVEDLFLLLVKFLGDCDLLLKGDTLLAVGERHAVQRRHQAACLLQSWVLARQLHVEDRRLLVQVECEQRPCLNNRLLS